MKSWVKPFKSGLHPDLQGLFGKTSPIGEPRTRECGFCDTAREVGGLDPISKK